MEKNEILCSLKEKETDHYDGEKFPNIDHLTKANPKFFRLILSAQCD